MLLGPSVAMICAATISGRSADGHLGRGVFGQRGVGAEPTAAHDGSGGDDLVVNPDARGFEADIGDLLLGAGVRAAGPVDADALQRLVALVERAGQLQGLALWCRSD